MYSATRNGTDNYRLLRNKVFAAIDGNATAKAEVTTFFTTARTRLGELLDMSDVRVVIFGIGAEESRATGAALPKGWMRSLLISGMVEANDRVLLNIGSTWPGGTNLLFDGIHNNHVHISLSEAAVDN